MIYSPSTTAALGIVEDAQPEEPLTLRGEGLWVCLISSGKCVVSLSDLELMPAGSALLLPPQNAAAGHLVLSRGPLTLAPENECHLLCVQLTGQAAEQFLAGLSEMPFLARGETCPAAAELMGRLAEERDASERVRSQLAFALLCELSDADSAAAAGVRCNGPSSWYTNTSNTCIRSKAVFCPTCATRWPTRNISTNTGNSGATNWPPTCAEAGKKSSCCPKSMPRVSQTGFWKRSSKCG